MEKIKVGIVGGAGYTGEELLRILAGHPGVQVTFVSSETLAGKKVSETYLFWRKDTDLCFEPYRKEEVVKRVQLVFLAKPQPNSFTMARDLYGKVKIVDLSGNFRFTRAADFERWYEEEHQAPELLEKSAYGLPELFAARIKRAGLTANPGCYPTAVILGAYPLFKHGLVSGEMRVSAVSGFSGAGRTPSPRNTACALVDNLLPYRVGVHPHAGEVADVFQRALHQPVKLVFVPQVAGFERGIMSVLFLKTTTRLTADKVYELYRNTYRRDPFIRIYPPTRYPELKPVLNTNYCDLGFQVLPDRNLVVFAALDNLVKGAAGQAVQNLNLMAGLSEDDGLPG